ASPEANAYGNRIDSCASRSFRHDRQRAATESYESPARKSPFFRQTVTSDGRLDGKKLVEFLLQHTRPPADAEKRLADAIALARREGKRVLLRESGHGCYPCLLLSRYLDDHKELLAKDYIVVSIDGRQTNCEGIAKRIWREPRSVPWMAILDADGKPLITSLGPEGNIGFPGPERQGIKHFEKMLRTTAQRMTEQDIESLLNGLAPKGP
ncbi:MAG: hypothetical protein HYS13_14240, partial [Planctomycetia bacterium]|nr:hypothetical protein [Planctomycetia bacterium]